MTTADSLDLLADLIARAKGGGADAADAVIAERRSLSVSCRLSKQENLERSEAVDLGLRVFVGKRQALVSTSDFSKQTLGELVDRALAMARSVPEDPYCGLADAAQLASETVDVDAFDASKPDVSTLFDQAAETEVAARAVPGVTNSEGSEAAWGADTYSLATSNGFARTHSRSWRSLSVSVLAGQGTAMERDYDYTSAVYAEDLRDPAEIGRSAGERAARRLHARKVASTQVPIVYDPRVARSLLNHFASAINGSAVARGTTFLKDRLGQPVFSPSITIVDDPLRRRGLRSRPFDGEGIAARRLNVIDRGVLASWVLDLRSARQLGLTTTGHAARGVSSPPSPAPSNLYMEPGERTPGELMADIQSGFYVTELIGFGVNGVTGDYSRGASGFWIENGALSYPVHEVTIAGNLIDMFAHVSAANDLEFRYGVDAPTIRVDGMTVAGR